MAVKRLERAPAHPHEQTSVPHYKKAVFCNIMISKQPQTFSLTDAATFVQEFETMIIWKGNV